MQYTNADHSISCGMVPETGGNAVSLTNPLGIISAGFQDHYGTQQYIAPNGELVSVPLYKLTGDSFSGSVLDTNIWTANVGVGGNISIGGGELTIATGTTANNAVELTHAHPSRFSGLAPNKLRIVVQLPDTGVTNNLRHWGLWTAQDGATFQLSGTTFQLVTRKGGVDTVVADGSVAKPFNGQYGSTFVPGTTSHFYEIIYQPRQVVWLADNKIIHTFSAAAAPWSGSLHLPIHYGSVNSGGLNTNVVMKTRLATVARFGIPQTQPDSSYIAGAQTVVCKNSPGNLHAVVINSNTGTRIILYDGLDATGAVLASINPNQICTLDYKQLQFSTGLTVVTTGATTDCTIIYE